MNPLAKRVIQIHQRLLEFYGEPIWRNPLPAIDELVSTILSQNTNDINRDRGFHALRAKFPTWEQVPIDVHRHLDAAVPHLFLNILWMSPFIDELRGKRMAQIVEPNPSHL